MKNTIILFILVLAGCSANKFTVQSTIVKDTNYNQFTSFKFFNPDNLPKSNFTFSEANQKLIFDLIAGELKAKGFSSHLQADLIIKVQGGTKKVEESEVEHTNNAIYRRRYNYNTHSYNNYRSKSDNFTTIIIDVINADNKKLLWQGVAFGELIKDKAKQQEKIENAMQELFLTFPFDHQNVE